MKGHPSPVSVMSYKQQLEASEGPDRNCVRELPGEQIFRGDEGCQTAAEEEVAELEGAEATEINCAHTVELTLEWSTAREWSREDPYARRTELARLEAEAAEVLRVQIEATEEARIVDERTTSSEPGKVATDRDIGRDVARTVGKNAVGADTHTEAI